MALTLQQRDQQVIWHPFTQVATAPPNIPIVKAEGVWLIAEDGKRYLDGTASWWVNAHGHAHPYIASQIAHQAEQLEHIIFAGFTHAPAIELAERLIRLIDGNQTRVFYSDNGSTSVEVALKMALQYFHNQGIERKRILAFHQAYHGDTFGAMSVGHRNAFSAAFGSLLFEVGFIPAPEPGNEALSINMLRQELDRGDCAAFIFEPLVQGANGMRMHSAEALSEMIALCRNAGTLTIADEVFTGFYRTGKALAVHHLNHKPDIICLSKALTGGTLPLGVTAAPEFLYEQFISEQPEHTFFHGHSYTANPISCRAALASLDLFERPGCTEQIQTISHEHLIFSQKTLNHPAVFEVRTLGTILAIELKTNTERGYLNPMAAEITAFFLSKGIYLRPLGNVIYVTPPYSINKTELEIIYSAIREFLETHLS